MISQTPIAYHMFNNKKPNIILLADYTDVIGFKKSLGVYKVAHVLRLHGFEVAVIHHLSTFTITEIMYLLENLISEETLFVGISNFYYADISTVEKKSDGSAVLNNGSPGMVLPHGAHYNTMVKTLIKNKNSNCQLIVGGSWAFDSEVNRVFDYVVLGYSEMSVVNLAKHLLDKSVPLIKNYKSIHGPIIIDDSRAEGYDFSNSNMEYLDHDVILPNETLLLEVARGCIFKCGFCSYPMNGKKKMDFIRHPDLIKQELLDNYNKFGVTRYVFCDDTVNDSPEKCKMIYEISKSLPFKLEWWGYIRLDLLVAHPETVEYLFESGLTATHFGIETLNPKSAAAIGKGGNKEKMFETVQRIKDKYGNKVSLHASFIYGLPYESVESMRKTQEFLLSDKNPLDSWEVFPMQIKPSQNKLTNDFLSDIDKNYHKYGYRELGRGTSDNDSGTPSRHVAINLIW